MYRVIPSRRQIELPFSGLLGVRGAIGALYSVYSLPTYSCNSEASIDRARKMCARSRVNRDGFSPRYGSSNSRYPNTSSKPYVFKTTDLWSGENSKFDPCLVQSKLLCKTTPPPTTTSLPPNVKTPWNCPECFPKDPPRTAQPPRAPEDPVVIQDVPVSPPAPPAPPIQTTPDEPVSVFQEPEVLSEEEEEISEEDNTQYYVIGGIAALVLGGGLAYYFVTRKKKRK